MRGDKIDACVCGGGLLVLQRAFLLHCRKERLLFLSASYIHTHTYTRISPAFLGFDPDSEYRDLPFTNGTFFLDPCQPQLADLLNREEAQRSVSVMGPPYAVLCLPFTRLPLPMHHTHAGTLQSRPAPARGPWPPRSTSSCRSGLSLYYDVPPSAHCTVNST